MPVCWVAVGNPAVENTWDPNCIGARCRRKSRKRSKSQPVCVDCRGKTMHTVDRRARTRSMNRYVRPLSKVPPLEGTTKGPRFGPPPHRQNSRSPFGRDHPSENYNNKYSSKPLVEEEQHLVTHMRCSCAACQHCWSRMQQANTWERRKSRRAMPSLGPGSKPNSLHQHRSQRPISFAKWKSSNEYKDQENRTKPEVVDWWFGKIGPTSDDGYSENPSNTYNLLSSDEERDYSTHCSPRSSRCSSPKSVHPSKSNISNCCSISARHVSDDQFPVTETSKSTFLSELDDCRKGSAENNYRITGNRSKRSSKASVDIKKPWVSTWKTTPLHRIHDEFGKVWSENISAGVREARHACNEFYSKRRERYARRNSNRRFTIETYESGDKNDFYTDESSEEEREHQSESKMTGSRLSSEINIESVPNAHDTKIRIDREYKNLKDPRHSTQEYKHKRNSDRKIDHSFAHRLQRAIKTTGADTSANANTKCIDKSPRNSYCNSLNDQSKSFIDDYTTCKDINGYDYSEHKTDNQSSKTHKHLSKKSKYYGGSQDVNVDVSSKSMTESPNTTRDSRPYETSEDSGQHSKVTFKLPRRLRSPKFRSSNEIHPNKEVKKCSSVEKHDNNPTISSCNKTRTDSHTYNDKTRPLLNTSYTVCTHRGHELCESSASDQDYSTYFSPTFNKQIRKTFLNKSSSARPASQGSSKSDFGEISYSPQYANSNDYLTQPNIEHGSLCKEYKFRVISHRRRHSISPSKRHRLKSQRASRRDFKEKDHNHFRDYNRPSSIGFENASNSATIPVTRNKFDINANRKYDNLETDSDLDIKPVVLDSKFDSKRNIGVNLQNNLDDYLSNIRPYENGIQQRVLKKSPLYFDRTSEDITDPKSNQCYNHTLNRPNGRRISLSPEIFQLDSGHSKTSQNCSDNLTARSWEQIYPRGTRLNNTDNKSEKIPSLSGRQENIQDLYTSGLGPAEKVISISAPKTQHEWFDQHMELMDECQRQRHRVTVQRMKRLAMRAEALRGNTERIHDEFTDIEEKIDKVTSLQKRFLENSEKAVRIVRRDSKNSCTHKRHNDSRKNKHNLR